MRAWRERGSRHQSSNVKGHVFMLSLICFLFLGNGCFRRFSCCAWPVNRLERIVSDVLFFSFNVVVCFVLFCLICFVLFAGSA